MVAGDYQLRLIGSLSYKKLSDFNDICEAKNFVLCGTKNYSLD